MEDAEDAEESVDAVDSWLLPPPNPELPNDTFDNRLNLSSGITGGGTLLSALTRRKLPRRILDRIGLEVVPRVNSVWFCIRVSSWETVSDVLRDCGMTAEKQQTDSLLVYFKCQCWLTVKFVRGTGLSHV